MTGTVIKGETLKTCTQGVCPVKVWVVLPQVKELPETSREAWNTSFTSNFGGSGPTNTFDPRCLASRAVRQGISVVKTAQFVVVCFHSPRKLIQYILPLISVRSLVLSPSVSAGLLEFLPSYLHRWWQFLGAVMKAILSHVLHKAHLLCIPNKCPHLRSQQCPSPNNLVFIVLELLFSVPQWVL